jgi:hypothetical protein
MSVFTVKDVVKHPGNLWTGTAVSFRRNYRWFYDPESQSLMLDQKSQTSRAALGSCSRGNPSRARSGVRCGSILRIMTREARVSTFWFVSLVLFCLWTPGLLLTIYLICPGGLAKNNPCHPTGERNCRDALAR